MSGAFSNSHRSNPSPHPTSNVGRVYPEFGSSFNFIWWAEEELRENFDKDAVS